MKNRLAQETSPYLKQHEDNPVDWYPWGPEALERARRENKPILLSVGYSACHWCHVMAHESFENLETAKLMNEHFINVKVDREERPDLDQIYQNVAQAMNQGGGWPLTVFLTPDLRPFFGGTYFPPEDRYGRPGFPRVLLALSNAFRTEPENVEENAQKLTKIIAEIARQEEASTASGTTPTLDGLAAWAERVLAWVDGVNGGFGSAPKFPNTMMLTALWRSSREGSFSSDLRTRLADAVRLSLRKMAEGGIFDQLGGGFSRYSVDERWAVPHFEKMLYDNGLLLRLYSEVLASDAELVPELKSLFSETISKTVEYLLREMQSKDGLFYAAQDADSEGEEGKFFVWTPSELSKILSEDERTVFQLRYGVDEAGNFEHGATVLFQALPVKDAAARIGIALEKAAVLLRSAEKKVFSHREKRIRPGLDSKCLISWNGLLISGLVWASKVIEDENLAARSRIAALQAWEGVLKLARAGDGRLYSTVQEGKPKLAAYLDDYAFMARAALDLTLVAPERAGEFFEAAEKWAVTVLDHFSDPSASGYFFTSDDHEKLIQRPKSSSDQAIPSGSSVLYQVFQVLSEWTLNSKLREQFEKEWRNQVARAYSTLEKHPYGQGELFSSTLLSLQGAELWGAADVETLQTLLPRPNAWVKGIEKTIPAGQKQRCRRGVCEIVNAPNPG